MGIRSGGLLLVTSIVYVEPDRYLEKSITNNQQDEGNHWDILYY